MHQFKTSNIPYTVRPCAPRPAARPRPAQLCATVAHTLPEFALTGMVLELLQVDLQAGAAVLRLRVVVEVCG